MTELTDSKLRSGLIDSLRECRDAERTIFAALDPSIRDAPEPDGGWSPKDHLAHLSAWRNKQATRMAALRERRPEPAELAEGLDETNAIYHAERAEWPWTQVEADADATADALIGEVRAASDAALLDRKVLGPIMGDGPEHDVGHLAPIARSVGLEDRVLALAATTRAMIDGGGWPDVSAAYARYNLACFHAQGGRLDEARALLRQALPADESLRSFAPTDDDLIALRPELEALSVR
jgi:hypothetical protein